MPFLRAHGWPRLARAHFIAAFACLALAACQTDDGLTTGSINGAPRAVAFEELGPVLMKGIPEPVRLYRASR